MSDTTSSAPAPGQFLAQRELHRSRRTLVEVGTYNGRLVVAKRSADAASVAAKSRAAHEFHLLSQLRSEWVVSPLALYERDGLLLLEYVEGQSLAELSVPVALADFFAVADDICRALAAVHEAQLIHKDVNPSNLVRTRDGRTKLLDFDIAARLGWEAEDFRAPSQIEGTLAYIAPEQTGRTNRPIDHRADLYALGATFYYLLSGKPPFEARDPLELLHRHVAATPASLVSVPRGLDAIVQKLLAKNAEDRYQSALGVLLDLERLQAGALVELGIDDVSHRLTLPVTLIGRDREIATLQSAFSDVLAGGRARIALIAGSSGVGKTALVRELRRPLVGTRGYYLHGKFDPFRRDVPYSALSSALGAHVNVLLGEAEDELSAVRRRMSDALAGDAGALSALFPVLVPLLGPAAVSIKLSPREQQAHSERLLQRLFAALATREQPLLMFLDDLHWADPASLAFLERLARPEATGSARQREDARFVFVIGAYRHDEAEGEQPLREFVARLGAALSAHLTLGPLTSADVLAFTKQTLRMSDREVAPLAAVLHQRSGGSPFFVGQALLELYHGGVLRMRGGRWSWDAARIDSFAPSDRVVDISAMRLSRASGLTRELLCWAACLGSEFELREVVSLSGLSLGPSEQAVERAAGEGLLMVRSRGRYAFLHDRVRQAAYTDRAAVERRAMHRHIALSWLEQGFSETRLFELVAHLSSAIDRSAPRAELELLQRAADLNLVAAQKAHDAGAFDAAAGYADTCRTLLLSAHEQERDAYHQATIVYGEAQYSRGHYAEAHQAYDELLEHESDPIERSAIYRQKAVAKAVEGRIEEAFAYFGVLARELGFDFNTTPTAEEASGMVAWARESLVEFGCEELALLPPCEETHSSVLIDACAYFGTVAYLARPASFKALQSYTLIHCFDWGVSSSAPPMITAWAYSAASARDYQLALDVATAGCVLAEKYSPPKVVARARTLFSLFAAHYKLSADDCLVELRGCADICATHGDLEYAGYARAEHDSLLALTHGGGAYVTTRVAQTSRWADDFQVVQCIRSAALIRGFLRGLSGGADSEAGGESVLIPERSALASGLKLVLAVLMGDPAGGALAYAEYVEQREQLESTLSFSLFAFFGAVALTLSASVDRDDARLAEAVELVALHARMNPQISGPYAELLSALTAAPPAASEHAALFDAVLARTRVCRLPLLSALTCALASDALRVRGHERLAHSFAEEAVREYSDLSAHAAVRRLTRRFADAGMRALTPALAHADQGTFIADARTLDVWSVVKASQTLASELRVVPLISRLLEIACESAGAQRAVLLTRAGEGLEIAADLHGALEILGGEPLEGSTRVPGALLNEAFQKVEPLVIHDAAQDPRWSGLEYFRRASVRSVLCMPVRRGDERFGLLYLENALTVGAFPTSRIEVLRILASQAAVSLENARLLREEAEKQRLHRELEAAAEIQRALVPAEPRLSGAEVCVHMAPADRVGGDYYDVIHAEGREWFVMADVCGHGLPAGLIMIMCQTALHAVLRGQPEIDPVTALVQVNRLLKANLERFGSSTYVALTLFRCAPEGVIEHAGLHEDILIYRSATASVEVQPTSGTWLGIVDDLAPLLEIERFKLESGDVLLLYTDGLIDARAPGDGALWGRAALEALLRASGTLPLTTIRARILSALEGYRRSDDVTLFLLRR